MLKNIYAPLSGTVAQERVIDILSNNIANANTTGYKEDTVTFKKLLANPWPNYPSPIPPAHFKTDMSEMHPLRGNEMEYVGISDIGTDFTVGSLKSTQNPLDFALEKSGFFVVETPFGERFTRDGSFVLGNNGTLLTKNGAVVQGLRGPITGLKEGSLEVNQRGEIFVQGRFVDQIKTVDFQNPKNLQKIGSNLFIYDGNRDEMTSSISNIQQGYIESSNVNPVKNMTNLIVAHRNYEALQKVIKSHDEALSQANNKIGTLPQ